MRGLHGDGVDTAFKYARRYMKLSNNDVFALALAKTTRSVLLAGDRVLRLAAVGKNVEVHGHIWLIDEIEHFSLLTQEQLLTALKAWEDVPFVWLPSEELEQRRARLQR